MRYRFTLDGRDHFVNVEEHADRPRFVVDGTALAPKVERAGPRTYRVHVDDEEYTFTVQDGHVLEGVRALDLEVRRAKPELVRAGGAGRRAEGKVRPPMPGKVVEVRVEPGQSVAQGDVLVVLEAMKMQNDLKAPFAGVVEKVHVRDGQNVESTTVLVEIAPPSEDAAPPAGPTAADGAHAVAEAQD